MIGINEKYSGRARRGDVSPGAPLCRFMVDMTSYVKLFSRAKALRRLSIVDGASRHSPKERPGAATPGLSLLVGRIMKYVFELFTYSVA